MWWSQTDVNKVKMKLTVATVPQVCPDDVFLREAKDSESTSSHCGVYDDTGVCNHLRTLIETNSEGEQELIRGSNIEYIWFQRVEQYGLSNTDQQRTLLARTVFGTLPIIILRRTLMSTETDHTSHLGEDIEESSCRTKGRSQAKHCFF